MFIWKVEKKVKIKKIILDRLQRRFVTAKKTLSKLSFDVLFKTNWNWYFSLSFCFSSKHYVLIFRLNFELTQKKPFLDVTFDEEKTNEISVI